MRDAKAFRRVGAAVSVAVLGCAGTFEGAPTQDEPGASGAVIPADFESLPRLELAWESDDPEVGVLRGLLPEGEVVSGRVSRETLERDARDLYTGATDPGFESGADVFSPFPEQWPSKTNTALTPRRSSRRDVVIGSERGRVLDCRLLLNDVDVGLLGGARGVCTEREDGARYRTYVRAE